MRCEGVLFLNRFFVHICVYLLLFKVVVFVFVEVVVMACAFVRPRRRVFFLLEPNNAALRVDLCDQEVPYVDQVAPGQHTPDGRQSSLVKRAFLPPLEII